MWEIFDDYCWTKQKKVLTREKHRVPGLGNFAYWNYTASTTPSPLHYHSNIFEFHCMVKGVRYTQIEKDGKMYHYTVTGNQAMIVFPFEIHSNGARPQAPCEFFAFQVDVSDPYRILGLDPDYSYALYRILTSLKHHHLSLQQSQINYLHTAFNFFSEQNTQSTMIGVQFLTAFLFTLPFLQPVTERGETAVDSHLEKAILYIRDHLSSSISLAELAEASGYSLSRFKYKFHAEVGITPSSYIILQKMEEAKRQLAQTDISVTRLAYNLGFSSSNYFSSVFKKTNSISPRDYRKIYRQK